MWNSSTVVKKTLIGQAKKKFVRNFSIFRFIFLTIKGNLPPIVLTVVIVIIYLIYTLGQNLSIIGSLDLGGKFVFATPEANTLGQNLFIIGSLYLGGKFVFATPEVYATQVVCKQ